jgi:uracil-DNA glycosylase family 4
VHGVLRELGIEDRTMLWNAVPMHPSDDRPLSNRRPTQDELAAGLAWLDRLIALVQPRAVEAVGRLAASVLPGRPAIRHPAHGGARPFADQLAAIVAAEPAAR